MSELGTEQLPTTGAESRSVSPGVTSEGGLGADTVTGSVKSGTIKSILPPGVFMTSDHRYYWNGEGPVPSVTTILEVLSKPALVYWKASESVRALWRAITAPIPHPFMDRETVVTEDEVVKWALANVDSTRDKAAGLGSGVHLLADMVSRSSSPQGSETATDGFQMSEEEIPYVEAFRGFLAFLEAQGGRIVSSEHAVWSLNGYGGTYDLICEIPGMPDGRGSELWLVDIKTSKGYYPEYGLQLAGYRWADYIVLPMDPRPYPMPEIHRTGVLHLRPDQYSEGWALVEYPTTYEQDYLTFLGCLEVWKWRKEERFSRKSLNTVIRS